jgi:hypothetical protein
MKKQNRMLTVGLIGLSIHLASNLLGIFLFHKPAATFFSEQWWSSWFPSMMVWVVFIITGLAILFRTKPSV